MPLDRRIALAAALALVPVLSGTGPAAAQGIDCGRARGPVETAICGSPALLAQDRALGEAYAVALSRAADEAATAALRQGQRQWLAERNRACATGTRAAIETCLRNSLNARLAALAPASPAAAAPAAPTVGAAAATAGAAAAATAGAAAATAGAAAAAAAAGAATAAAAAAPAAGAPAPARAAVPEPPPVAYPAPVAAPGPAGAALPAPAATLRDPVLPTAERMQTLLDVTRAGRFAIRAESATGTALQLVDMLTGPGEVAGIAGASDGRLDLLLDAGTYRLRGFGAPGATGAAGRGETRLAVTPFRDAAPPALAPRDGAAISAPLADLERRTFWVTVESRGEVRFEAAGRALADLRLWREGSALVPVRAAASRIEPQRGRPLTRLLLTATLEPGTYLLAAYGGAPLAWSGGGDAMPFHLRGGASPALAAGRLRGRIGPLGSEVFAVASQATAFRLALPEPAEAELTVRTGGAGSTAQLARNARTPAVALLPGPRGQQPRLAEIRGAEGQVFTLATADLAGGRTWSRPGQVLAAAASFGFGGDEPPAMAVLARRGPEAEPPTVLAAAGVPRLGPGQGWRTRFNLRGPVTLLLQVTAPGPLALRSEGVALRPAIAPLAAAFPPQAADGSAPSQWDLAAGWYQLRLVPAQGASGVLDLTLGPPGVPAAPAAPAPADPLLPLGRHELAQGQALLLFTAAAPDATMALSARPLPADLAAGPLVATQPAGETLDLPLLVPAAPGEAVALDLASGAAVTATLARGTPAPNAAAGAPLPATLRLPRATAARELLVHWRPTPATAPAPRPAAGAPLPELTAGRPRFLDLPRDETRDLALTVPEGGLWRIETLGRLQTSGSIGTDFAGEIDRAEANGIGGNMLVQTWLRAGRYRVTVGASESNGRLGVLARPAALREAGRLAPGGTARASLDADSGAAFAIDIAEEGTYRLELLGLDRQFTARLEDAEGWPLQAAGVVEEPQELALAPGRYRLIVMPEPTEARVLARLTPVRPVPPREGHGPHALAFDATSRHQWREPATRDGARTPDRWDFSLFGPAEVSLDVTDGMIAELRPAEAAAGAAPTARIVYRAGFRGELAAGRWRVEARSLGRNDRLDYGLTLRSREIQPDLPRRVSLPAQIPFALAEDRVVGLTSFGDVDVRAVLRAVDGGAEGREAAGREVLRADDRADDWNIAISRLLPAGRYVLHLTPAVPELAFGRPQSAREEAEPRNDGDGEMEEEESPGSSASERDMSSEDPEGDPRSQGATEGEVEIRLVLPAPRPEVAAPLDGTLTLEGTGVHRLTLPAPGDDALMVAAAAAPVELVLALERRDEAAGGWRTVALDRGRAPVVAAAGGAAASGAWRVAAWTVDGGGEPIRLAARLATPPAQAPGGDVALAPLGLEGLPPLGVARLDLAAPQVLALGGEVAALRAGSVAGAALLPPDGAALVPQTQRLWLLVPGGGAVALSPLRAEATGVAELSLGAGETAWLPAAPAGLARAWIATSAGGQPGLDAGRFMGFAGGSAFALAAEATPLRAWNAGGGEPMRLSVAARNLDLGAVRDVAAGGFAGLLPAGAALPLRLPEGAKRLRLDLAAGGAAVLGWRGSDPVTVWSGAVPASRLLDGDWTEVLLVNAAAATAPVALSLAPAAEAPLALAPGRPLKRFFGAGGSVALPVQAAAGQRLVVLGAAARFQGADGRVRDGGRLALPGPGHLVLTHEPGPVAAWIEGEGVSPWPADLAPRPVALPARIRLEGPAMALALSPDVPVLLQARTTAPVIVALSQGGRDQAPVLFPAGAEYHRSLAAGPAELRLLSPQDGPLTGWLELTAAPVRPAREGLGEPVVVAPGGSALFGFEVARAARLGLGLRAEPDRVAVRLLDAEGQELAAGMALLRRLPPGRYLLEARVPPDAPTTLLRPAVIGLEPPPAGPPANVVQRYLDLVGLAPAAPR